jgi:hypothetical protein
LVWLVASRTGARWHHCRLGMRTKNQARRTQYWFVQPYFFPSCWLRTYV